MRRTLIVASSALLVSTMLTGSARAADVDRAPISYLVGDDTDLLRPVGLDLGPDGTRYVAEIEGSISVYAADATGNTPPLRSIGDDGVGSNATTLDVVLAVKLGPDGNIYVSNSGSTGPSVVVFAPDATGDATPLRVIKGANTGLLSPNGLAFDDAGRLYVASRGNNSIRVFPPNAEGNATPLRTIAGSSTGLDQPSGIAIDRSGVLHVANYGEATTGSVTSYPATAGGDVTPTRTIEGAATTIDHPWGLAVDDADNVYVGDTGPTFAAPGAVAVFGPDAAGDVAPMVRLAGPNTDLVGNGGVAVQRDHRVVVGRELGVPMILTFKALVPLPPGGVRDLGVAGAATAPKRKVTWKAPASDGDAPITTYRLKVAHGGKVVLSKKLKGAARSFTLKGPALVKGKNQVSVQAVNQVGAGPVVKRSFTVKR